MSTSTVLRDLQPDTKYTVRLVPVYTEVEGKHSSANGKTSKGSDRRLEATHAPSAPHKPQKEETWWSRLSPEGLKAAKVMLLVVCFCQRRWGGRGTCRSPIQPPAPSRCAGTQRRATSASTASSMFLPPAEPRTW